MKKYTLLCLLALLGASGLSLQVHAATTTFTAAVATNSSGQSIIDETLTVMLSSSNSTWIGANFYADGNNGNSNRYMFAATVGFHGPGTSSPFDAFLPNSGFAASGSYNCYAIAHGMNSDTSPPTFWDAGVTAVTVTVP